MSNPTGKSAKRYTRLERETAVRIANEHGVINDHTMLDIEKALGRRPTMIAVYHWKNGRKKGPRAVESVPPETPVSLTKPYEPNTTLTIQQAVIEAQRIDERATTEQLKVVLDRLIAIPREHIDKLPTKERLRAFQPLSDTWLRRLDISDGIIAALPKLRELEAFIERVKGLDGWNKDATLLMTIESFYELYVKLEARKAKFDDVELADLSDDDLYDQLEWYTPQQDYFDIRAEMDRRKAEREALEVIEIPELAENGDKSGIGSDISDYVSRDKSPTDSTVTPPKADNPEIISQPMASPEPSEIQVEPDPPVPLELFEEAIQEIDNNAQIEADVNRMKTESTIEGGAPWYRMSHAERNAFRKMSRVERREYMRWAGLPV